MNRREQQYDELVAEAGDRLISPLSEFASNRSTLKFKCVECDETYISTSHLYTKTSDGKRCAKCNHHLRTTRPSTRDSFIDECRDTHGGYYGYEAIPESFALSDEVSISCPKHGPFNVVAAAHKHGSGCQHCNVENVTLATSTEAQQFISTASAQHGFKYNYARVQYVGLNVPVVIECPKHGTFSTTPLAHMLSNDECPLCMSKNAPLAAITSTLDSCNIIYTTEKMFNGCVGHTGRHLRYDIYIPDRNLCIEYDGLHHFEVAGFGNDIAESEAQQRFLRQLECDEIKNQFCSENGIHLLRIPYTVQHPGVFVKKHLTENMPAERYMYTYDMLAEDVRNMSSYIKSFNYSRFAVYGIARGGIYYSTALSYHFDAISEYGIATYRRYDGCDKKVQFNSVHSTFDLPIFVVDDLISSGETMAKVVEALKIKFPDVPIHPVVVFGASTDDGVFYVRNHPKQWVVFPYEV